MRLTSADIWNVGPHAELSVTFSPGSTAVVGRNGSGKSTLMNCIHWALSGDRSRLGHSLGDAVSVVAPDAPAGVRVTFAPDPAAGATATLERRIEPSGRALSWGGKTVSSQAAVAEQLERWFGLPPAVVGSYLFVAQGALESFLRATPAARRSDLSKLFRLDQAAAAYDAVKTRLTALTGATTMTDEMIANLSDNVTVAAAAVGAAETSLAACAKVDYDDVAVLERGLAAAEAAEAAYAAAASRKAAAAAADRKAAAAAYAAQEEAEAARQAVADNPIPAHDMLKAAEAAIAEWKWYNSAHARRDRLQAAAAAYVASQPVEPAPWPEQYDHLAESARAAAADNQAEANAIRARLAHIHTGLTACPTCGTPVEAMAARIEADRLRLAEVSAAVTHYQAEADDFRARKAKYEAEALAYQRWHAGHAVAVAALAEAEANLPDKAPDLPEAACAEYLAAAAASRAAADAAAERLQLAETRLAVAEAAARTASTALRAADAALPPCGPDVAAVAALREEVGRARVAAQTRVDAERAVAAAKAAAAQAETALAAAKAKAADPKLTAWRGTLSVLSTALHPAAVPAAVAGEHMAMLQSDVNLRLSDLGADFRVTTTHELVFVADFGDGVVVTDDRLSGGQQAVLALAWRLAVQSRLASRVGLLCLDEPTNGLDADRRRCLRAAFERLRGSAYGGSLQCVVVTHDRELATVFDKVIDLDAKPGGPGA